MGLDLPGERVFSNLSYYPCPGFPSKSCTYTLTLDLFQQHLSWYDCRELVMRLGRLFLFSSPDAGYLPVLQPVLFPDSFNICETKGKVNACDCFLFHLSGSHCGGGSVRPTTTNTACGWSCQPITMSGFGRDYSGCGPASFLAYFSCPINTRLLTAVAIKRPWLPSTPSQYKWAMV